MTQDEIIAMAREAGCVSATFWPDGFTGLMGVFERFAALVAAAERESCALIANATVCDTHIPTGVKIYGSRAATAIRQRGAA